MEEGVFGSVFHFKMNPKKEGSVLGDKRKNHCIIIFGILIILGWLPTSTVYSQEVNIDELVALSPTLSRHVFYNISRIDDFEILAPDTVYHPFGFLVEKNTGRVIMIQGMSYEDRRPLGWYPWFDQNEGEPASSLVFGSMYTQQIYLYQPVAGFSKMPLENLSYESRGEFGFAKTPALNFFELKAINPKLEYYQKMEPAVSDAGDIVFFAPPGPGLAFVTEENGDILAMMATFPGEEGRPSWAEQARRYPIQHPVLGDIYTANLYFQEPGERYDLTTWLQKSQEPPPPEEGAFVFDGFIEPGFVLSDITLRDFFGMLMVNGKIKNVTENDYHLPRFKAWFYNAQGEIVGEYELIVYSGLDSGKDISLGIMTEIEPGVDLTEVTYYFRFEGSGSD